MVRRKEDELEDLDQWDLENAERQRPGKSARAIVSVAFSIPEFDIVAGAAERLAVPTSRYIREAAIDQATGAAASASIQFLGWTTEDRLPQLYGGHLPVIETLTRYGNTVPLEGHEPVVSGKAK